MHPQASSLLEPNPPPTTWEDILFGDVPGHLEQLRQTLEQPPPGSTTVDALRGCLSSGGPLDDEAMLRLTAALTTMSDRLVTESGEPVSHAQATAILEEVLEFSSGGQGGAAPGPRDTPTVTATG